MKLKTVLAAAVVVALIAPAAAATPTRLTIDADHQLDTDAKMIEFEETGTATATMVAPAMELTVASEHEECGIEGFSSDIRNDYFCVQYQEEIDRTLRIYIPAEYWSPYVRERVEPVSGDAYASFTPVEGGQYTAVEATVTEPGTYAWRINSEASYFAGAKSRTLSNIEKVTGVGAPQTDEWQYISPDDLGGNQSAYVLRAPNGTDAMVVEYQQESGEWTAVPDEHRSFAPVYWEQKAGVDDRIYVFATDTSPPEVRYKTEAASTDQFASAWREIMSVGDRLEALTGTDLPFIGGA